MRSGQQITRFLSIINSEPELKKIIKTELLHLWAESGQVTSETNYFVWSVQIIEWPVSGRLDQGLVQDQDKVTQSRAAWRRTS